MADVFNNNPSAWVDMNDLFTVLNDKVGLTDEQWRKAIENTYYLKNHLGLADVDVGNMNTVFTAPGTLADVVVSHREETIGGKTIDKFDYTFYIPSPKIETSYTVSQTSVDSEVGTEVISTPIYGTGDNYDVVVGYNFAFDFKVHVVDMSNYLAKDNETAYTPISDYNPSTKKYVDDLVNNVVGGIDTWLNNIYDGEGV